MTLRELHDINGDWMHDINGDWNYPVGPTFEFHYPTNDGMGNSKPYRKCGWSDISEEVRNTKVLYFETISKSRVWIELDI